MKRKKREGVYCPDCYVCDISRGRRKPNAGGAVLNLKGNWTLSHYADKDTFLGRMGLQPYEHRDEWHKFKDSELTAFGRNIQAINKALLSYWAENFSEDPIQRIYVICFSEGDPDSPHLHFHLIPRTEKMATLLKCRGSVIAWDIYKLNDRADFPEEYLVDPKQDNRNVQDLMIYLADKILGASIIKTRG